MWLKRPTAKGGVADFDDWGPNGLLPLVVPCFLYIYIVYHSTVQESKQYVNGISFFKHIQYGTA